MHVSDCLNTKFGKLYKTNAQYVLDNLQFGIDAALKDKNLALVTGPISKENIISINKTFTGHTEYIQQRTESDKVLMLLASDQLKVALATTHVPLKEVANFICNFFSSTRIRAVYKTNFHENKGLTLFLLEIIIIELIKKSNAT